MGTHRGGFSTFRYDLTNGMKAEGNVVGSAGQKASKHVDLIIDVKEPHLWNGMADPYCYTAVAKLINGEAIVDEVEVRYGYRNFRVDAETGFWLNGKNVPLRGVARHQDREDKGWAISKEDQEEDIVLFMDPVAPRNWAQANRMLNKIKK